MSFGSKSPRACGIFRSFFAQVLSTARGRDRCALHFSDLLGAGTKFSVSYHWQMRLEMRSRLPASMVFMGKLLFSFCALESIVQAIMVLSLDFFGCEV